MATNTYPLTLGEGNTPLIRSRSIGPAAGISRLYFKLETFNPTGSYKDRFAVAAINGMLQAGQKRVFASSSGNAGASLAAYCAAAGLTCEIAVVSDAPASKLRQMQAYGARIWRIRDFGLNPDVTRETLEHLRELGRQPGACLQISAYLHCPLGMSGVESLGEELIEQTRQLGEPLHHVFSCAGGGGLAIAVARGCQTAAARENPRTMPRIHCVQPEGNDTIAGPLREGLPKGRNCQSTTKVSGLQVANVIDGNETIAACRASGGTGFLVSDERVFEIQRELARKEGIFCEPAAAVALAGALQAVAEGTVSADDSIVCLITGTGFKDQASVERMTASEESPALTLAEFQKARPSQS